MTVMTLIAENVKMSHKCVILVIALFASYSSSEKWTFGRDRRGSDGLVTSRPLILGHRGASGSYPEHTSLGYEKGAQEGADVIECDVEVTKDLQLVCSHESWIREVCDVGSHPEFYDRRNTYTIDDDDPNFDWNDKGEITDYFTFDLTLQELQTLKRKQVQPFRNPYYNGKYSFCTLQEYVNISKTYNVGIIPEIKSATAINQILAARNHSHTVETLLLTALDELGYSRATDPCFLQSFELSTIERLSNMTELRRVFLLKRSQKTDETTLKRVQRAGTYAMCVDKELLVEKQSLADPKPGYVGPVHKELIDKIHALGMKVYAYTFRNEHQFLKWDYQADPNEEYDHFLRLGLDGYFTDFPGTLHRFFLHASNNSTSTTSSLLFWKVLLLSAVTSIVFSYSTT